MMILRVLVFLLGVSLSANEIQCQSPVPMLEKAVDEVKGALKDVCQNQATREDVEDIISQVFIPYVDVPLITKQILGRRYWQDSTMDERKELEVLVKRLMSRQYAAAFSCDQLDNEMAFFPMRGELKKYTRVESRVELEGKEEPIMLRYAVRCVGEDWRIYDMVVNGISLGQTYRSQFNTILKKEGAKGLIRFLEEKLVRDEVVQSE